MASQKESSDVRDAANDFLAYLSAERAVAKNTLLAYEGDLEQFLTFCTMRRIVAMQATLKELRDFLAHLRRQDMSPRTLARKAAAVRQFYRFLLREGRIDQNPAELMTVVIKGRKLPKSLTRKEMDALIQAAEGKTPSEVRDRAMLELWYATGARVSELASLRASDIDWERGFVKLLGKGARERLVPITRDAVAWAQRYREVRHEWLRTRGLDGIEWFFLSRLAKRFTRQGIWKIVKKYARLAGIQRRVWPHMLRHTFATHVLRGGADLRVVQEMLGHRSISTTEIYTHLDVKNLKLMQSKYHPRG